MTRFTLFGRDSIEIAKSEMNIRVLTEVAAGSDAKNVAFSEALCNGFLDAQKVTHPFRKPFQHRDYIYFLRMLRERADQSRSVNVGYHSVTPAHLFYALRRHMSGFDKEDFARIASCFFQRIHEAIPDAFEWETPSEEELKSDRTLEMLSDSLRDRVREGENPNTSPFRYPSPASHLQTKKFISVMV